MTKRWSTWLSCWLLKSRAKIVLFRWCEDCLGLSLFFRELKRSLGSYWNIRIRNDLIVHKFIYKVNHSLIYPKYIPSSISILFSACTTVSKFYSAFVYLFYNLGAAYSVCYMIGQFSSEICYLVWLS